MGRLVSLSWQTMPLRVLCRIGCAGVGNVRVATLCFAAGSRLEEVEFEKKAMAIASVGRRLFLIICLFMLSVIPIRQSHMRFSD